MRRAVVLVLLLGCEDPLSITTTELPPAELGVPYEALFTAEGGSPPYVWEGRFEGEVAPGLTLDATGLLHGVPTQGGRFPVEVVVSDTSSKAATGTFALGVAGEGGIQPSGRCESPVSLVFGGSSLTVTGTLSGVPAESECGNRSAVYYAVESLGGRLRALAQGEVDVAIFSENCSSQLGSCSSYEETFPPAGRYVIGVFGEPDTPYLLNIELNVNAEAGTCERPIDLDLSTGEAMFSGHANTAPAIVGGDCLFPEVRGYVARFTLTEPSDVVISTTYGAEVGVVRENNCGGDAVSCWQYRGEEYPVEIANLQPGTYFLIVQVQFRNESFIARVRTRPPTLRPAHDRCSEAVDLGVLENSLRLSDSFLAAEPEEDPPPFCGTDRSLYYRLTVPSPSRMYLNYSEELTPELALMEGCGGPLIECTDLDRCADTVPAGTHILRVTAFEDTTQFSMLLERMDPIPAPANDLCADAPLILTSTVGVQVEGTFHGASLDLPVPSCAPFADERDVAYGLVLTEESDVRIDVSGDNGFDTFVALYTGTCGGLVEAACVSAVSETIYRMPPGQYLLVASDRTRRNLCANPFQTDFTLDVTVTPSPPPPANDTCIDAEMVTFAPGATTVAFSGTTVGATDDEPQRVCDEPGVPPQGNDVYYRIDVPTDARLRVTPTSAPLTIGVSLHSVCGEPVAQACGPAAGRTSLSTPGILAAGSYILRVEDQTPAGVDFTFVAELLP